MGTALAWWGGMQNRALLSVFACCLALLGCESPATGGVGPFGSGKAAGPAPDP